MYIEDAVCKFISLIFHSIEKYFEQKIERLHSEHIKD